MGVPVHIVESMGTLTKIQDWVPVNNWLVFLTAQSNVCFWSFFMFGRLMHFIILLFFTKNGKIFFTVLLCFRCIYRFLKNEIWLLLVETGC